MKKIIVLTIMLVMTLSFLHAGEGTKKLRIAVAGNLSFAIKDLKQEFQKANPDLSLEIEIGSTGALTAKILNGAEFDLMLAADMARPLKLQEAGFAVNKPVVYAKGRVIIFSAKPRDLKKGLEVIKNKNIKTIAIASIKLAPYGKAAWDAIEKDGLTAFKDKLVYTQNVSQAVQYALSSTDLAFIAKSAVFAPKMKAYNKEFVHWVEVDPKLYSPIEQGMILMKGKNQKDADKFYKYMLSANAGKILKKYGYE
jgi:molybdate transport system substrate-binding protein